MRRKYGKILRLPLFGWNILGKQHRVDSLPDLRSPVGLNLTGIAGGFDCRDDHRHDAHHAPGFERSLPYYDCHDPQTSLLESPFYIFSSNDLDRYIFGQTKCLFICQN